LKSTTHSSSAAAAVADGVELTVKYHRHRATFRIPSNGDYRFSQLLQDAAMHFKSSSTSWSSIANFNFRESTKSKVIIPMSSNVIDLFRNGGTVILRDVAISKTASTSSSSSVATSVVNDVNPSSEISNEQALEQLEHQTTLNSQQHQQTTIASFAHPHSQVTSAVDSITTDDNIIDAEMNDLRTIESVLERFGADHWVHKQLHSSQYYVETMPAMEALMLQFRNDVMASRDPSVFAIIVTTNAQKLPQRGKRKRKEREVNRKK
jgi:hypothetical protein